MTSIEKKGKMDEDKTGRFVRVYMKNGHVFHGAVQSWSNEDGVALKSTQGERIIIPCISEISAYVFIVKQDGTCLKERSTKDPEPTVEKAPEETNVDRIKSLVELHKLKAATELEMARSKLRAPTCTSDLVEYDTVSVLRTLKDNPRKQGRPKKRRDSKRVP